MKGTLGKSLAASYKRTPKVGKGDKLGPGKRQSKIQILLSTPGTHKKMHKTPIIKKASIKVI
jgi:hypothetical protein